MCTLSNPALLRLLEVSLRLFAFFFPEQAQLEDKSSYDIIIAGAGSAGCVLANRLSKNKHVSVLLIEDGDNPTLEVMLPGLASFNQLSKFDWNYTTVNESQIFQCNKGDIFQTARGHGLGGSSAINYMLYARGDPNDYRQWADISKDSSWNYDQLLKYFKRSEKMKDLSILNSNYKSFHGTKGEMKVSVYPDPEKFKYLNALEEVGFKTVLDTNGNDTLGFNFPSFTAAGGVRQSSCYCFVSPVRKRKNLYVLKNTKVTKVLFNNNVATGVQVLTENKETWTFNAKLEVILSAGAFNTPQILMLSGIGPQKHLQTFNIPTLKNLPVGHNLQDHIGVLIIHQTDAYNSTDTRFDPYTPQNNFLNGFIALDKSQTYPDSQLLMISTKTAPGILRLFNSFDDDIIEKAQNASKGREILLSVIQNVRPLSRGRVELRSANAEDPPKIYLGSFSNATDVHNTIRYIEDFLRIEKSTYFKSVNAQRIDLPGDRCKGFTVGSRDYWECYSRCLMVSIFHYSGTCPMGTVVDSRLRVLGIRKLRVVDASVFPIIPSANPNAPTIMTAEKAADMIKADNKI